MMLSVNNSTTTKKVVVVKLFTNIKFKLRPAKLGPLIVYQPTQPSNTKLTLNNSNLQQPPATNSHKHLV